MLKKQSISKEDLNLINEDSARDNWKWSTMYLTLITFDIHGTYNRSTAKYIPAGMLKPCFQSLAHLQRSLTPLDKSVKIKVKYTIYTTRIFDVQRQSPFWEAEYSWILLALSCWSYQGQAMPRHTSTDKSGKQSYTII